MIRGMDRSRAFPVQPGLCGRCAYGLRNTTRRGTTYLRCGRAAWDDRLVKYPQLPVLDCVGFRTADRDRP